MSHAMVNKPCFLVRWTNDGGEHEIRTTCREFAQQQFGLRVADSSNVNLFCETLENISAGQQTLAELSETLAHVADSVGGTLYDTGQRDAAEELIKAVQTFWAGFHR